MPKISYYKNAKDKESQEKVDLKSFLLAIRSGKHKEIVNRIRELIADGAPKPEINRAKEKLPNATISGTFHRCQNDQIIDHSGFIAIDIDGKDNPEVLQNVPWWRDKLAGDPYTYAIFQSVSGAGLCIIVPISPDHHRESFKGLQQYYAEEYDIVIDSHCINEARVRYTSYDPDLVINEDAGTCDMIIEEAPTTERVNSVHVAQLEPVLTYLENQNIDITQSYNDWFYVGMSLATVYGEDGRDYYHRISQLYPDYDEDKADKKYNNYLETSMGKLSLGTFCHTLKKYDVPWAKLVPQLKEVVDDDRFFYVITDKETGLIKRSPQGAKLIIVDRLKFIQFLQEAGFAKYYPNENFEFIRVQENIVSKVTAHQIQDFVLQAVMDMPSIVYTCAGGDDDSKAEVVTRDELHNKILSGINVYFSDKFLASLLPIEIKPSPVDAKTDYYYYKNGVVKITPSGTELMQYSAISWHVWDSQIIDRTIRLDQNPDFENCEWATFLKMLANVTFDNSMDQGKRDQLIQDRFLSLMSITGYLLHSHKSPARAKAVVLLDQNDTDNPEGGTGKGLFAKGISQIKNAVTVDGKNFTFDKNFVWQRLDIDTQIVVMDDVSKHFPFERMFSLITEGWPIEKKNKGEIYLTPEKSPKILILDNYVIDGEGASFDRRMVMFELGRSFSQEYTPEDYFEHILFYDWDDEEWNLFDHFMLYCLQFYLNNGIIKPTQLTIRQRKLEQALPMEVLEFLEEYVPDQKHNAFIPNSVIMERFRTKYNNFNNLSTNKFSRFLTLWSTLNVSGMKLEKDKTDKERGYRVYKPKS